MSHVCETCGGKGWRWNGHARVHCARCRGTGAAIPYEDRDRGPERTIEDPSRTRMVPYRRPSQDRSGRAAIVEMAQRGGRP